MAEMERFTPALQSHLLDLKFSRLRRQIIHRMFCASPQLSRVQISLWLSHSKKPPKNRWFFVGGDGEIYACLAVASARPEVLAIAAANHPPDVLLFAATLTSSNLSFDCHTAKNHRKNGGFLLAEMERFELSRRLPDLHP